ncbi:hypothetical protein LEN26_005640 [Aphanomyces euteiches]|nr:hypothetical protein AeMF1_016713 [Aphanomyces euteiches]KAH9137692.1 hypothetical protein LEN26_005640 [Aphanomyces euteiches]KAH9197908.1 hypothetical protein AeNC1_000089 [Aphanomyces euteiches]
MAKEAAAKTDLPVTEHQESRPSQFRAILHLFTGSWINILLLLAPVAIVAHVCKWPDIWVFVLNFFVMMPLANILGEATEALAEHTGDTIGGLVNATFGNAVEIIISIFALSKGEIALVQSSLIGSMLSNLLLVLGMCFLAGHFGGAKNSKFSGDGASINMSLLFVGSFAMLVPSYYLNNLTDSKNDASVVSSVVNLSHISAIFLVLMYIQLMVYQLVTHRTVEEKKEEEELPDLSFASSLVVLLLATALVAVFSEFLVGSVDGFTESANIPKAFVGLILLPIVGNAVEHITALRVAYKDNMELAMGVAVGSATQIALFVTPVCVIAGWIMSQPMTLAFNNFEAMTYIFSTLIVYVIVADGSSNWLEGSILLTMYCLIGLALLEIHIK